MPDIVERAVDTVLCDIGGVLIAFDPRVASGIEARHGLGAGTLLPVVLKSEPGRRAMVGELDDAQWRRAVSHVVGEDAVAEWLDYHGEADYEVVAHLKEAKDRGARVVLLSNATRRLWDDIAFHGLSGLADVVLCSADIGRAKPDPACYLLASHLAEFTPGRTLYVDDTPSWVAAGTALGMRGHVFTDAAALGRELVSLDLLP